MALCATEAVKNTEKVLAEIAQRITDGDRVVLTNHEAFSDKERSMIDPAAVALFKRVPSL